MSGRKGPLADRYWAAVALVVTTLVPFLCLTAAVFLVAPQLGRALHLSTGALDVTIALSDGAYAVGTVLAVQFATHLPGRRMLLVYVSLFFVSALLAAWAPTRGVFIGAFIVEGFCTSLMLIAAVPPLVTGWPPKKMPGTGTVMNLAIFGAVAVGPTVGALQASTGQWRPLFWGVAGVAGLAVLFALLTFEDVPPSDTSAPWDFVAIGLAVAGCGLAFFGAGLLEATDKVSALALAPLLVGFALVGALVVYEYRLRHPLMPVRQLATTFPVVGILIALFASASAFGLMELALLAIEHRMSPAQMGIEFLPEFGAAILTAGIFGALFRTRFTPILAFSGLVMLATAAALLTGVATGGSTMVEVGAGLIGLGVGASVSPALFLAGFSLRSSEVQRVFAMIELLRGVTAFLVAPILLFLAAVLGATRAAGIAWASWICFAVAVAGALGAGLLFWLGDGRLRTPDLETWEHGEPAWHSPPLLARRRGDQEADGGEEEPASGAAERRGA